MDNFKVSVVIPAYNAEKYLRDCLKSIKQQTYRNFEIIVVDDCSFDNTFKIAQAEGAIVIKNRKNLGEGASRNIGARKALGEIIAHTDSDVVVPKNWLEKIINDMEKFNVKCVAGGYAKCFGNSFIERFPHFELVFRRRDIPKFVQTAVGNNFASTKDIFFEAGGFGEKYKCEDIILSYKISRKNLIYWDKDNGVYHHFRDKLSSYLKQQYYFARDTVVTYYRCPELFFLKTHQGRQLYFETIFIYLFYILLIFKIEFSFLPLFLIMLMNINFLAFLSKNKVNWFKSLGIILLRDFACSLGVISGIIHSLLIFVKDKILIIKLTKNNL